MCVSWSHASSALASERSRISPHRARKRWTAGAELTPRRSAALVDADVRPLAMTGVDLARPTDARVGVLAHLEPVRDPAGQAPEREHHREHVHGDADRLVDHARVEVDVRVELALDEVLVLERDLL